MKAATLLLLAVASPILGAAAADPGGEGPSWVLLEIGPLDAGTVRARVEHAGAAVVMIAEPGVEGALRVIGPTTTTRANAQAAGLDAERGIQVIPPNTFGAGFILAAGGTRHVVVMTGGDVTRWSYTVEPSDVAYREVARGPVVTLWQNDFTTERVAAHASTWGVGAEASLGSSYQMDVEHTLLGYFDWFFPAGARVGSSSHSAPSGAEACPCLFTEAEQDPGVHRFTIDGAVVRSSGAPVALLADVPLPE